MYSRKIFLAIFFEDFEAPVRYVIEKQLQIRPDPYDIVVMLPVPRREGNVDFSENELKKLYKRASKIKLFNRNSKVDSCLFVIIDRTKSEENVYKNEDIYPLKVREFSGKFNQRAASIYLDDVKQPQRLNSQIIQRIRKHHKLTSSLDFSSGNIGHIRLTTSAKEIEAYEARNDCIKPNYSYKLVKNYQSRFAAQAELTSEEVAANKQAVCDKVKLIQQKAAPIVTTTKWQYRTPLTPGEALGNLFDAYAKYYVGSDEYEAQELAKKLAQALYKYGEDYAEDKQDKNCIESIWWYFNELKDDEADGAGCIGLIKDYFEKSKLQVEEEHLLNSLRLEVIDRQRNRNILQVGKQLKADLKEQYEELREFYKNMEKGEAKTCIEAILKELKALKKSGMSHYVLLDTTDAIINFLKDKSEANCNQLYKVANEFELSVNGNDFAYKHQKNKAIKGLLLCLLGITLGIAIGLTLYFTGGAALIAAPMIGKAAFLSAALVTNGIIILGSMLAASLPLGYGSYLSFNFLLFEKPTLQTNKLGLISNINKITNTYQKAEEEQNTPQLAIIS